MSKRIDDIAKRLDSILENIENKEDAANKLVMTLDLELRSPKKLELIITERFLTFKSLPENNIFDLKYIVSSFRKTEVYLCRSVFKLHKDQNTVLESVMLDRCYAYAKNIENYNLEDIKITNTFPWSLDNPEIAHTEILRVYNFLRGENKKSIELIKERVSSEEFLKLMTNKPISNKIIWNEATILFVYFIDEIGKYYFDIPKRVENVMHAAPNVFSEWINPKILDCFLDRDGANFNLETLATYRNRIRNKKNFEHKEMIDELFGQKSDIQP